MSIRDQYALEVIKRHHKKLTLPTGRWKGGLPRARKPVLRGPDDGPINVGIIGAGAAGLYAALMIDSLGDPSLTYEILDADPMKDRKGGGRLFTYHFSDSRNDYFDIGAMRFPDIPFMKRVFDLIRDDKNSPIADQLEIIDYVMDNPNNLNFYNGILKTDAELDPDLKPPPPVDPFHTGVNPPDGPPNTYSNMIAAALGPFKQALVENFDVGWENLMQWDEHSTRDYMAFVMDPPYPDDIINWCETFDSATNLYDCALSESVMDSLDFDFPGDVKWYCIQGGAGLIADTMVKSCRGNILRGNRVTAIAPVSDSPGSPATSVNVTTTTDGVGKTVRNYSHVISTMPFGSLRMVDTTQCGLDWTMQTAMRALHYDSSVKVAIKFASRWWEDPNFTQNLPHRGGVSSTDRPTRTIVYPSYGIGGSDATMIASYTWAQDAMRLGAFSEGSPSEQVLINTIIKDLADMHGLGYQTLSGMVRGYKVHNWYTDNYSAGAFALFGPGQFKNLYPQVTAPPTGLLHFAGEATSVHHAWVVGAFNSAYRTIHEILFHEGKTELIQKMKDIWGTVDEVDDPLLEQQVALGQHVKFGGRK
jgi:monoamine oxidase